MTESDQKALIAVAAALAPKIASATHAERVTIFRELAESAPFNPEAWAVGGAVVVQYVPPEANRTSAIAALAEAAFDLGYTRGVASQAEA